MRTTVLPLAAIPGPMLRAELRAMIRGEKPWTLIVDVRRSDSSLLGHLSVLLRLRRRVRNRNGELVLVVDEAARRRLTAVGLHPWLPLRDSIADANQLLDIPSTSDQGASDDSRFSIDDDASDHDSPSATPTKRGRPRRSAA